VQAVGTEEKLILASVELFREHGFSGATTKAIAKKAGVAEVTLFRIFGDKQTLFIRSANYIAGIFGLMEIPNRQSGDFRQDMLHLCQNLLGHFIRYNDLFRMLFFEAMRHGEIRAVMGEMRGKALKNIQTLVCRYADTGGGQTIRDLVEWLSNSLMGASLSYCLFHATEDIDAYIRLNAGMIADALIGSMTTEEA
jgi:AcrR family transcriptional regulator